MIVENFSSGVLTSPIGVSDTVITVNTGNTLPVTPGVFTAIIWNNLAYTSPAMDLNAEIVLGQYSSINTYTIVRAQEGTLAAGHNSGVAIGLYITAGVIYGVPFSNQRVVTGSRALATPYQNTTGKAMHVVVSTTGVSGTVYAYSDSTATPSTEIAQVTVGFTGTGTPLDTGTLSFMVIPGNYYQVSGGSAIACWTETY